VPFVRKSDSDAVALACPKFFDEPVVQFALPLPRQEFDNLLSTGSKLNTIAPLAVYRVGKCDFLWISRIPSIFGFPDFLPAISRVNGDTRFSACCALILHFPPVFLASTFEHNSNASVSSNDRQLCLDISLRTALPYATLNAAVCTAPSMASLQMSMVPSRA
jgi:hypothetical protein